MTLNGSISAFTIVSHGVSRTVPTTSFTVKSSSDTYIGYDWILGRVVFMQTANGSSTPAPTDNIDLLYKYISNLVTITSIVDLRNTAPIDGDQIADGSIDYSKLPSLLLVAGNGLTGGGPLSSGTITFNAAGNIDGSIIANANDLQVGVLATDAQHGTRGGGTTHAVATTGAAGFQSAADKAKEDALGLFQGNLTRDYVEGSTETFIGTIWLPARAAASIDAEMGCLSASDTATLKLYRQSDGTLIQTVTRTNTMGMATAAGFTISSAGCYELRGYCSSATGTAVFRGASVDMR